MVRGDLLYPALLTLSGLVALAISIHTLFLRSSPGKIPLFLMMAAMTVWNWTYALHWLFPVWPLPGFWLNATYLGVVTLPAFLLSFALRLTRPNRPLPRALLFFLPFEPVMTLVLLWTDPLHHLFFGNVPSAGSSNILNGGPWFWINLVYSYSLILTSYIILIYQAFKSRGAVHRKQILICLAGNVFVFITNIIEISGVHLLPGLDLTPIVFTIAGVFFEISLLSFRMLDLVPVAKELLMDQMQDGMIVVDRGGRILDINRAAAVFFGASISRLIGKKLAEVTQPSPALAKALLPLQPLNAQVVLNNDSLHTLDVQVHSLQPSPAIVDGFLISWRDISQLKRTEQALSKSYTHTQAILNGITDAYVAFDRQWRFIEINQVAAQKIYTKKPAELLIGQNLLEEYPEAAGSDFYQKFQQAAAAGHSIHFETQAINPNSWWEAHAYPSEDKLEVYLREITERKQFEDDAIQRAQRFEALAQISLALSDPTSNLRDLLKTPCQLGSKLLHCAMAVRLITPDGQWLSPVALALQGEDRLYNLVDQLQAISVRTDLELIKELLQSGQTVSGSRSNLKPLPAPLQQVTRLWLDGFPIDHIVVVPVRGRGKISGLLAAYRSNADPAFHPEEIRFIENIADYAGLAIENARLFDQVQQKNSELEQRVRERTEDLQRSNIELALASRVKNDFLATMSHELRTPLNGILTLSESMSEGIYGAVNPQQNAKLQVIQESGLQLLEIINNILDLTSIEAGQLNFKFTPVDVNSVCHACLQMIQPLAQVKGLQVTRQMDPQVTFIPGEERYLKQMIANLLSNAVKFTPMGGQIGVEVRGDLAQEVVHLTVWDTGIGIAPENLEHIFQPFVQVDSRLNRQYQGTGLGLSLVSHIAERHGGSVSVDSAFNVGSRFCISLPWKGSALSAGQETGGQEASPDYAANLDIQRCAGCTLLIAEDNETNFEVYQEYLTAKGYHIVHAANGTEAVERVKQQRPDLVLMDIQMPVMDGLEAIRLLRADAAVRDIPILALTALAMKGDRERCLEAGADAYLPKPISGRKLLEEIVKYLPADQHKTGE